LSESNNETIVSDCKNYLQLFLQYTKDIGSLVSIEAQLASHALKRMALLLLCILPCVLVLWLMLCALLFFYLLGIGMSWLPAFSIVFILNMVCLIVALVSLLNLKKYLHFSSTRKQLKTIYF
jgi:hypothetical protein